MRHRRPALGARGTLLSWRRRAVLGAVVVAFVALASCSGQDASLKAIRDAYAKSDYEETIVQCKYALRNDIEEAEVYYFYGLALLSLGRDFESVRRLQEAADLDSSFAPRAFQSLIEHASDAYGRGERKRASDRLRAATELQPEAELGLYQYLVGDAYFEENRFEDAARLYQGALAAEPDTALAEQAWFNLARCQVVLGDSAAAMESLEKLMAQFPGGDLNDQARWRLCNLLYESARAEFLRGNYETVVESITMMLERAQNASLIQRARFVLGEAYERLGEYRRAYEQYRAIIDEDRGASGRIVERARERIAAFRDSGLL